MLIQLIKSFYIDVDTINQELIQDVDTINQEFLYEFGINLNDQGS